MGLLHKLFFKRFTEEEYNQLVEIHKEETKALRRRSQFIIGNLFWGGLMYYFLFKAIAPEQWRFDIGDIIGCIAGTIVAGIVLRFILKPKTNKEWRWWLILWLPSMFLIGLLISMREKPIDIKYLLYCVALTIGFVCLNDSIRDYFCERLLQEQKKQMKEK